MAGGARGRSGTSGEEEVEEAVDKEFVVNAYVSSCQPPLAEAIVNCNTAKMSFARAFSPTLREIRILCSQSGPASAGTR